MKVIVSTTGEFSLVDRDQNVVISKRRPHLVENTNFVSARAALGQLKILATDVDKSKTDEEWAEHYKECDGNLDLALASFLAPPVEQKEPRGRKR